MAIFDADQQRIIVRIIYDGLASAGKTTNLRQLCNFFTTLRRSELYTPLESENNRTLYFDWLQLEGGLVGGYRLRCQLITVPGQMVLARRRSVLLKSADVVVVVCDSTRDGLENTKHDFSVLRAYLHQQVNPDLPIVVQANKQDLPGALTAKEIAEELALPSSIPVVPACAHEGTGVKETTVLAIRAAANKIQKLLLEYHSNSGVGFEEAFAGNAQSGQELYQSLLDLESRFTPMRFEAEMKREVVQGGYYSTDETRAVHRPQASPTSPYTPWSPTEPSPRVTPTEPPTPISLEPVPVLPKESAAEPLIATEEQPPTEPSEPEATSSEESAEVEVVQEQESEVAPAPEAAIEEQPAEDEIRSLLDEPAPIEAEEPKEEPQSGLLTPLPLTSVAGSLVWPVYKARELRLVTQQKEELIASPQPKPEEPAASAPQPPTQERPVEVVSTTERQSIEEQPATPAEVMRVEAQPTENKPLAEVKPAEPKRLTPPLPLANVASGFIWPVPKGREMLKQLPLDAAILRQDLIAPSGMQDGSGRADCFIYEARGWCLKTALRRRFPSIDAARSALLLLARTKLSLGELLPPDTTLSIQQDEDGGAWLWTVSPWTPSMRADMNLAASQSNVSELSRSLRAYAKAILSSIRASRAGLTLDVHPSNFFTKGEHVYYLDDDVTSGQTLTGIGHAILYRIDEYRDFPGALDAYLVALEELFLSSITQEDVERLALHSALAQTPTRSARAESAAHQLSAVLARCSKVTHAAGGPL